MVLRCTILFPGINFTLSKKVTVQGENRESLALEPIFISGFHAVDRSIALERRYLIHERRG
jgi:hypothetical protein